MKNFFLKDYLFLFDIDGTIIDTKGKSKEAFFSSFEEVNKVPINENVSFLGGIDNLIFKEIYFKNNLSESLFSDKWLYFKKLYPEKLSKIKKNSSMLFKYAKKSIKHLYKYSNIALVTGNIKDCAMIKLKLFNLDKYFSAGGFGDSATDRSKIIYDAINSSELFYKRSFKKNKIILFGDTQKDVKSAKDASIISFLIDHKKNNFENAKLWKADFYGDFGSIPKLIKLLEKKY